MRLFLCLAATLALCQASRIPRGVVKHLPHFHAIHHGHGATSYQNVQLDSRDSVPVPTVDHTPYYYQHHPETEEHMTTYLQEQPHDALYEDHYDIAHINELPIVNHDHHQPIESFVIVNSDHSVPSSDDQHEHHENVQYILLEEVPYINNKIHEVEVHDTSQLHYVDDNYHNDYEYES